MNALYLGFDIGTTNSKVVSVDLSGRIEVIKNFKTKKYIKDGVEYIDLFFLEKSLRKFIDDISSNYKILGISFSSIGESIVPVKKGKILHDPILWYDRCTEKIVNKNEEKIKENIDYSISGVRFNYIYSLFKILWMKENLKINDEDYWLPISSVFPYIFTKKAIWDYSQACRTYMFDIHKREWHEPILNIFNIPKEKLGDLKYTGSIISEDKNGLRYFLSGHDHITGLFAVKQLNEMGNFIYQSMGSSSVVAAVIEEKESELHLNEPFMKPKGTLGVAFKPKEYYIESSIRYFGKLLEWATNLIGCYDYNLINSQINNEDKKRIFEIAVNADPLFGDKISGINLSSLPLNTEGKDLIFNLYLYLVYMSRLIVKKLQMYGGKGDFFCGGRCSENNLLIKMLSDAMEKPVKIFNEKEITALGAIMAAILGNKDKETKLKLINKMEFSIVLPEKKNTNKYLKILEKFYKGGIFNGFI